jgi:hypothetical protein
LAQGATFILAIFVPERVSLADKGENYAIWLILQAQNECVCERENKGQNFGGRLGGEHRPMAGNFSPQAFLATHRTFWMRGRRKGMTNIELPRIASYLQYSTFLVRPASAQEFGGQAFDIQAF